MGLLGVIEHPDWLQPGVALRNQTHPAPHWALACSHHHRPTLSFDLPRFHASTLEPPSIQPHAMFTCDYRGSSTFICDSWGNMPRVITLCWAAWAALAALGV